MNIVRQILVLGNTFLNS